MLSNNSTLWEAGAGVGLVSLNLEKREALKAVFTVKDYVLAQRLTLCWVDADKRLHHFYELAAAHVEHTFTGDAFIVFDQIAGQPKPTHVEDVKPLFSFRSMRPPALGHEFVVALWLSTDASGSLSCGWEVKSVKAEESEYRVIVRLPHKGYHLPSHRKDWILEYTFVCPPLPLGGSFNKHLETFYIWGDLSFGGYGAAAKHRSARAQAVHPYKMNQLVPQLMCGRCLAANDENFKPIWQDFETWVIQAQYYWQTGEEQANNSRAQCGDIVHVSAGETLRSVLKYSAVTGGIDVSIEVIDRKEARSSIHVARPFPNDTLLFESWSSFFRCCEEVEDSVEGCIGRPTLNVEYKGRCSVRTLKSICPFTVKAASYPGFEDTPISEWRTELFSPRLDRVTTLHGVDGTLLHVDDAALLGDERQLTKSVGCIRAVSCRCYSYC